MNSDTTPNKLSRQVFVIIQIDMISVLRNPKSAVRYWIFSVDAFLMNTNAELNTVVWELIFEKKNIILALTKCKSNCSYDTASTPRVPPFIDIHLCEFKNKY